MRLKYPIVSVSEMSRSIAFYRDVLGFHLKFESPFWSELATDEAAIALHLSDAPRPAGISSNMAGQCRPGFSVPDLDDFHKRMLNCKVCCTRGPQVTFGAKLAEYLDPDGLAIVVSEDPAKQ